MIIKTPLAHGGALDICCGYRRDASQAGPRLEGTWVMLELSIISNMTSLPRVMSSPSSACVSYHHLSLTSSNTGASRGGAVVSYVKVRLFLRMFISAFKRTSIRMLIHAFIRAIRSLYVRLYVCLYVRLSVRLYVRLSARLSVCYVRLDVRFMHICTYVYSAFICAFTFALRRAVIRVFIRQFIRAVIRVFIRPFIRAVIHDFIRPFIRTFYVPLHVRMYERLLYLHLFLR